MANLITSLRIVCSIAMLFTPALSGMFYTMYLLAGFTDMIDGTVARKTNTVSVFGSKLDTVADIVFVGVCLYKLIPILDFSAWMITWIGIIAIIKCINVVLGYALHKQFKDVHSILNKVTGAVLFLLPLSLAIIDFVWSASAACLLATYAAIHEGYVIVKTRPRDEGDSSDGEQKESEQ